MKIRIVKDVEGKELPEAVEQHVEAGHGRSLVALGLAEEVIPEPIKHQPTIWSIRQESADTAPYLYAKCNCKQGKWWIEGPNATKQVLRHVIMIPDEHFVGSGDYIFINGNNLGPFKIVNEKCPVEVAKEYEQRYKLWAARYARKPRLLTPLDVARQDQADAISGKGYGPIWIDSNNASRP